MRALVTGGGGFAGRHLVARLVEHGHEVITSDRAAPADVAPGVVSVPLDVTDPQACWEVLTDQRPEAVFHLAGLSHVARCEAEPEACLAVNAEGTRHLLEACLSGHANVRVLLVSSAEVYGRVDPARLPVTEDQALRPATVYGASKASAEMFAHHAVARGLHVGIARAFNHIGPGQSEDFVASAFARQVAAIEAGAQEPVVSVGNLAAVRDLADVRDTVAAYEAILTGGAPGEVFNVAGESPVAIQHLLDVLVDLAKVEIRVEVDPARMRPVDVPVFHGSARRLRERTGWRPRYRLETTLADVLEDWRAREDLAPAR